MRVNYRDMWDKIRTTTWEIVKFVVIVLIVVVPIRTYVAQPFIVSGNSMYPSFNSNEYLIIDELSYHFRQPERGEVIVFKYPKMPQTHFIKRVIGLPGETVIIKNGEVIIDNGQKQEKLTESYLAESFQANFEIKLLPDEYFVMGDNRAVSLDSRSWGPLESKFITGRVLVRLFPPNRLAYLPGMVKN